MKRVQLCGARVRGLVGFLAVAVFVALGAAEAGAANWKGLEPLKSRRADVERALGQPVRDAVGADGTLEFTVLGGRVTVLFVTPKFIAAKKLSPELEGTVLQIVLQHDSASDTPASLKIDGDKRYERESEGEVAVYRNLRDGVVYTFRSGKLITTRYSPPAEQLARLAQRKK
ncbi:MAG TPA: hypothetical protein VFX96_07035 [Pyrinomonadaceae bacterium]|nr:hypothetical protein [Pyrinomonadaceae bacterium]